MPLAFVETAYWGGPGTQGAVVWQDGVVVLGPVVTSSEGDTVLVSPPERDINRAARFLGVVREGYSGLCRFGIVNAGVSELACRESQLRTATFFRHPSRCVMARLNCLAVTVWTHPGHFPAT
jgi:hypothetical protein